MATERSGERRLLLLYWSPEGRRLRLAVDRHLRALDSVAGAEPHRRLQRGPRRAVVAGSVQAGCGAPAHDLPRPPLVRPASTRRRARSAWIAELRCPKLALPAGRLRPRRAYSTSGSKSSASTSCSTPLPEHAGRLIPRTAARAEVRKVLTGYVDERDLASRPRPTPLAQRDVHIVYRATKLAAVVRQPRPAEAPRSQTRRWLPPGHWACAPMSRPTRRTPSSAPAGSTSSRRAAPSSAARVDRASLDRRGEVRASVASRPRTSKCRAALEAGTATASRRCRRATSRRR